MKFLIRIYNWFLTIWEHIVNIVEDNVWTIIAIACFVVLIVMILSGNDSPASCN